jgi:NAD-dependent DNA ligase
MTDIKRLNDIMNILKTGDLSVISLDNSVFINNLTVELLNIQQHDINQITKIGLIIGISNILYNNTDRSVLVLEDGIYDLLLSLYKRYNPNYQIGAEPIQFEARKSLNEIEEPKMKKVITKLKSSSFEDFLYHDDILKRPDISKVDLLRKVITHGGDISKRIINTPHMYPKLVGTLDKCKFVLNNQAIERGVFDDANVEVFERDFIQKHIESGILDPRRKFYMVAELKYDGVSVEAEVSNRIHSARSRGDTNNDVATDLTPILQGYKFKHAEQVPEDNIFGMKFEAILTKFNLSYMAYLRNKEYKNCRNAIIGLFGSSDANLFSDFITLVPLATSLEVDRLTEIEFMNKYYHSGTFLKYAVLYGDYREILFQVKRFHEEADYLRDFLPFMYDGIVVSYIEPDLIDALGRQNSVNKYSVAIKFNPLNRQTVFLGYSYTVGQNGVITPMIHYNPVEFYGQIHDKSTGHSYKRFRELGLKRGDIINVEYTNDVMPYVTKADIEENYNNPNLVEEFVVKCPSCNGDITISDSGKSAICRNPNCPERVLTRMVNTLDKLNFKDFSEEALKAISKFSFTELMNLRLEDVLVLGENDSVNFMNRIEELKTKPIYDYKIIGALGFTNLAEEKWKLIFSNMSLKEFLSYNDEDLYNVLVSIKGLGPVAATTIRDERTEVFLNDLITISSMNNIVSSKGVKFGKSIRFTGFRDSELAKKLTEMGHDANNKSNVTSTTDILIIPEPNHKVEKRITGNTIIVALQDFLDNMDKYLS